jgi:hypothetical protein
MLNNFYYFQSMKVGVKLFILTFIAGAISAGITLFFFKDLEFYKKLMVMAVLQFVIQAILWIPLARAGKLK